MLSRNTRFFVLVGVFLLVGLAIACTIYDSPRAQFTPVSTSGDVSSATTSEITPTQTSATEPGSVPLQPVIRLHYGGQVYDGIQGNFCWPVEPSEFTPSEVSVCADEGLFPWQDLDLSAIPVTAGDSVIVEIEASEHAGDPPVQAAELDPGLTHH